MTSAPWWPADVVDSWLWGLDPAHFRVAFALLALAARERYTARSPMWGEVEVPVGGVLTTLDRLAERCGSTRAVVRRALDKLEAGPGGGAPGLIRLESSARGYTLAILADPAAFGIGAQRRSQPTDGNHTAIAATPIAGEHSAITAAVPDRVASTAPPHEKPRHADDLPTGNREGEHSMDTAGAQLDLGGNLMGGRGGSTRTSEISDPDPDLEEQDLEPVLSGEAGDDGEPEPDGRRPRVKADRIPDRAWAAADYLRSALLEAEPDNAIGRRRWGGTTGHRLTWANEFRLLHEQDARPWDEIARVVSWLFKGQPPGDYRFRVESPASLRKKWDAIQARRTALKQPRPVAVNGQVQRPPRDLPVWGRK